MWAVSERRGRKRAERFRSGSRFGFTTSPAALFPHRRRKRKPGHLSGGTELPDSWAMSPRGLATLRRCPWLGRGRATFVWVSPPGWAMPQRRLELLGGADAAVRARVPSPERGPGSRRGRLKPPTYTARTRRACKSQPRGCFPGAPATGWRAGDPWLVGAEARRTPALLALHRRTRQGPHTLSRARFFRAHASPFFGRQRADGTPLPQQDEISDCPPR